MSRSYTLLVAFLVSSFPVAAVFAQEKPPVGGPAQRAASEPARTAETEGLSVSLRALGSLTFDADIKDTPGDVEIYRAGVGLNLTFQPWDRARLGIGVEEEVSWYLFHNARGLIPGAPSNGDPFELGLITTFSPRLSVQHDEHWSWFVGGLFQFSGEPDVAIGDSGTYGGFAGARYAFSDRFSLSLGFAARSELEDDTLVIPLIGIDWKITDRVSLSTEGTFGKLQVSLADQWFAALFAGWELREYRLRNDGPLPDGVARDSRIPIGVSLTWRPTPDIDLTLSGGAIVWQRFRFDDNNGQEVSDTNSDPAPFLGLSAEFRF